MCFGRYLKPHIAKCRECPRQGGFRDERFPEFPAFRCPAVFLLGGIVRVTLPNIVEAWGEKMLEIKNGLTIAGIVWLAIGVFLSFVGYF